MSIIIEGKRNITYQIDNNIISINKNDYEIQDDDLGAGGNSSVRTCLDIDGRELAVKFLLNFSEKGQQRFEQEIQLMQMIDHPNLIRYIDHGTVNNVKYYSRSKKGVTSLKFVVMDKADTNLLDYIKSHQKIEYYEYASQFRGLCSALAELHKLAIHRDIKPENILIKGGTWILSDFGLCEFISPELHRDITTVHEKVGPQFWMSPEALDSYYFDLDNITKRSDVFQLCAVFAFVINRRYPGGILNPEDIKTIDPIRKLIISALSNKMESRPVDGKELYEKYKNAIEEHARSSSSE